MAIENKRMKQRGGAYGNFNASQGLDREINIVTGGDPNSNDGRSAYVTFEPGVAKRLATVEDLQTILDMSADAGEALNELIAQLGEETVLQGLLSDINSLKSSVATKASQAALDAVNDSLYNMFPGGTNILRNTNEGFAITTSSAFSAGTWNMWSASGTYEVIEVSDAPNPDIKKGMRLTYGTGTVSFSQRSIPLVSGQEYTMSCYVRCTSGGGTFYLYPYSDGTATTAKFFVSSSEWRRYSYTFTAYGNNMSFLFAKSTEAGTLELSGMKLEVGNKATDWSLSPWDSLKRGNTDISSLFSADDNLASLKAILCAESFISLYCNVKAGTSGWVNVSVVPSAYRPITPVPMAVMVAGAADGAKDIYARITTAGVVSMYISASLTYAIELYAFYPIAI